MPSVTQRIKQVKQPYGGYIKTKLFEKKEFNRGFLDNKEEDIPPQTVGLVVDYLTRLHYEKDIFKVFDISLRGFNLNIESEKQIYQQLFLYLDQIKNLTLEDDELIIKACILAPYDSVYRAGIKPEEIIPKIPNAVTIEHIRTMVKRTIKLFGDKIPNTQITFRNGYTSLITTGDGDFSTDDTIYDLKVSKQNLNSKQTLQLYLYYLLAKRSKQDKYKNIDKIAIYNPRLDVEYTCNVKNISKNIQEEVETEVMGLN